jgi:biotin synthase
VAHKLLEGSLLEEARRGSREALAELLSTDLPWLTSALAEEADRSMKAHVGSKVYYRGLLEFSNHCTSDCLYCGIRAGNTEVERYTLDRDRVMRAVAACIDEGYGSLTLQSGERRDPAFVEYVCSLLREIKEMSRSDDLPEGLGITLCVGEQDEAVYRRFFAAGAHRYLLRIESGSPELFASMHPESQSFEARLSALRSLRRVGFQVGTGVMIGLPGQSAEDLADDILFFRREGIDMIGMGPYIPHAQTPMGSGDRLTPAERHRRLRLSLRMIALTRIVLCDVNIAATTALQALDPLGREMALAAGANVVMPILTPGEVRAQYTLYNGKPCTDEDAGTCTVCISRRVASTSRRAGYNEWGDSPHFAERMRQAGAPA